MYGREASYRAWSQTHLSQGVVRFGYEEPRG